MVQFGGEGSALKLAIQVAALLVASLVSVAAAQCSAQVSFRVSAPDVTTSAVTSGTVRTEAFASTGSLSGSGSLAIGSFTLSPSGGASVAPDDQFGGTGSNYLGIQAGASLSVTLTEPAKYVGFFWGAGDANNLVAVYGNCGGSEELLATFTSTALIGTEALLGANHTADKSVTAANGQTYSSNAYWRELDEGIKYFQPFAYVNLELNDPSLNITRVVFSHAVQGGFEIDNITTSTAFQGVTSTTPQPPTNLQATAGDGEATVSFTPGSDGGLILSNYDYSLDGSQTWSPLSPADTTSPVTITGLANGVPVSLTLRAVNANGPSAASSAVTATPCPITPPTDASSLTLTPTGPYSVSNGAVMATLGVSVSDGSRGLACMRVVFEVEGDATGVTLSASDAVANGSGTLEVAANPAGGASATIASTRAGEVTVHVKAAKVGETLVDLGSQALTFLPGPPASIQISVTDSRQLSHIPFGASVTLLDAFGNPTAAVAETSVALAVVNLAIAAGGVAGELLKPSATPASPVSLTDVLVALGASMTDFEVIYTGVSAATPSANDIRIAATASGLTPGQVDFQANPLGLNIAAGASILTANGASQTDITVSLTDVALASGVANQPIRVATTLGDLLDGAASVTDLLLTTDADGVATVTLQAPIVLGVADVSARCPGLCSQTVTVEFVPGPPAALAVISGSDQVGSVAEPLAIAPRLRVVDAFNHGVPSSQVVLEPDVATAVVSPTDAMTESDGSLQLAVWRLGLRVGEQALSARVSGTDVVVTLTAIAQVPFAQGVSAERFADLGIDLRGGNATALEGFAAFVSDVLAPLPSAAVASDTLIQAQVDRLRGLWDASVGDSAAMAALAAEDYQALGFERVASDALATFVNSVLAAVPQADLSRARIDAVVVASERLLLHLAGAPVTPPLGVEDFAVLGVRWVDEANLASILTALVRAPSIAVLADVQRVVDAVVVGGVPTGVISIPSADGFVLLFDPVAGADAYEFLLSPSDGGWTPQSAADRGEGVSPRGMISVTGLNPGSSVEVFVRARIGGALGEAVGPITVTLQVPGPPLVLAELAADAGPSQAVRRGDGTALLQIVIRVSAAEGAAPLENAWVKALDLPEGMAIESIAVSHGWLREFDTYPGYWYWERATILPGGEVRTITLNVRVPEVE